MNIAAFSRQEPRRNAVIGYKRLPDPILPADMNDRYDPSAQLMARRPAYR